MPALTEYDRWPGCTVVDCDGMKIGTVATLFVESPDNGRPKFAAVHTGMFGTKTTVVPLDNASTQGDDLAVPFTKSQVKDAPRIDAGADISPRQEQNIYSYYGFDDASSRGMSGREQTRDERSTRTGHAGGPDARASLGGDDAMTRSEERLHIGTENVETGRARLRKYVVTENVQRTVPVTHEEIRVEREPITGTTRDAAHTGPDLTEQEREVTLHAERPVVQKETVPVERVRLSTEQVTQEEQVNEQVRREEIDIDVDDPPGR